MGYGKSIKENGGKEIRYERYYGKEIRNCVGFEVFTAVVMKSIIFWDMTLCSPLSCTRRFGGK
jgi:hypothetical protein